MKVKLIYSLMIASLLLISQISVASPTNANLSISVDASAQPSDPDFDSDSIGEEEDCPVEVYPC